MEYEDWKSAKDGLSLVYTKGNLMVIWEPGARKYEVLRVSGGVDRQALEKGRAPHLPVKRFLHYVELTWSNYPKN